MTVESRFDVKELDAKKVRRLEIIAEQASLHPIQRLHYIEKAFRYANDHITGEQAFYRQRYMRVFYDMLREYDVHHSTADKNHNI